MTHAVKAVAIGGGCLAAAGSFAVLGARWWARSCCQHGVKDQQQGRRRRLFSSFSSASADAPPGPPLSMRAMRMSVGSPAEGAEKRRKSMIYTRTGDKGESSLYNGERRLKDDVVFEALGATDELNAAVGVAREHSLAAQNGMHVLLAEVQSRLMDVGAAIATPLRNSSAEKVEYTKFNPCCTEELELAIDTLDGSLPALSSFILPSGGLASSHLHVARTVCRRAERRVQPLVTQQQIDAEVGRFLNRLSDFFFVAARYAAAAEGKAEAIWEKRPD